jgi:ferritin-like metal-binding protein YciE
MAQESSREIIIRYLQDAIAAEKNFETQLRLFAKTGDQPEVRRAFEQHAEESRRHHERLTGRLSALGGSPSMAKSFLAHLFGLAPVSAEIGHDPSERVVQNLVMAYAVENAEIGMYESLAIVAAAAGDVETERLAREIQAEERATAEKVWNALPQCARDSFFKLSGGRTAGGGSAA